MTHPLYTLQGIVITGQKRGKDLGFPTANIPLTQPIPEGIYAATVTIGTNTYPSATFIGSAQTFNEEERKAESYILDFTQDIYGEKITIKLYKKIRDNQRFTSVEDLIDQMNDDVAQTRIYFQNIQFN